MHGISVRLPHDVPCMLRFMEQEIRDIIDTRFLADYTGIAQW